MNPKFLSPILLLILKRAPLKAILSAALMFTLGVGIADYLGMSTRWNLIWGGLSLCLLLLLASAYLCAYFDLLENAPHSQPFRKAWVESNQQSENQLRPAILLQIALVSLAGAATLVLLLVLRESSNHTAQIFISLIFILLFFQAVPPLRLAYSGYGELLEAIVLANLIPALAFSLQAGDLHRLVAMTSFPLTFLYLALLLAFSLPHYSDDVKFQRQSLMSRLEWQRGMNLHNILILLAYVMLGLAAALGLPWALTWPGLLTLPVGLFQIWQITQIAGGRRPNWRLLAITAISTFALTGYMLTYALWTG
jgi:1,4-dihydroxy-2-naphthoate octaprenyltransferase